MINGSVAVTPGHSYLVELEERGDDTRLEILDAGKHVLARADDPERRTGTRRAVVDVKAQPGGALTLTGSQAVDVVLLTIESMRRARQSFSATGRVHLFMAAPAGLSFMLGQLLNTFGEVQTYEHLADRGHYVVSALLRPSD